MKHLMKIEKMNKLDILPVSFLLPTRFNKTNEFQRHPSEAVAI